MINQQELHMLGLVCEINMMEGDKRMSLQACLAAQGVLNFAVYMHSQMIRDKFLEIYTILLANIRIFTSQNN